METENEFEILSQQTTYLKKNKIYTILFRGVEVKIEKWWIDDSEMGDYENDYQILNEEDLEELSTEDMEDLDLYIIDLN